ncbi:MAG: hypothetical protein WA622_16480, partial [Mycobacterium sp.]
DRAARVALRAPAGLVGPGNRAALDLVDPVDLVAPADMNPVDPAVMVDTVRVDLASPGARVDLASPGARERGREAQVLNPDRAQWDPMPMALDRVRLGRMQAHLDPTPAALDRAHRDRMRARPDPTPAHRLWAPTTRAAATRPEARIHLVEAIPQVEAIPLAEANHRAERPNHRHVCVWRAAWNFPD